MYEMQSHECSIFWGAHFITTCDEFVCADLGLKYLRNRRDFHKLQWHYKVIYLNDKGYYLSYYQMSRIR